jgi:hypothetical protein
MRIKFERSGGFAGMLLTGFFDLDEMDEKQSRELHELLDQADFRKLPEQIVSNAPVPDQFTYTISVETKEWQHSVITGDTSAPPELQPLLQTLSKLARARAWK